MRVLRVGVVLVCVAWLFLRAAPLPQSSDIVITPSQSWRDAFHNLYYAQPTALEKQDADILSAKSRTPLESGQRLQQPEQQEQTADPDPPPPSASARPAVCVVLKWLWLVSLSVSSSGQGAGASQTTVVCTTLFSSTVVLAVI